ncbi:MAG: hypothetical protein HRT87_05745 [Legionellales bacterium]|nr:hypothetical protein [Legionellales bacterium]
MIFSFFDIITCISFLGLLIFLGNWRSDSTKNTKIFLTGKQDAGCFALTAALSMTTINTGLLLSFSSLGFSVGLWALSLPLIFLLGLIFYTLTVAEHWRASNQITVAHYFSVRINKEIATFSAAILFIAMIGFSATYIKSLALIFEGIVDISTDIISVIITILVLLIVFRGGLKSIIRTDILSIFGTIVMLLAMGYGAYYIPTNIESSVSFSNGMTLLPPAYIFSLLVLTVFSYIISPSYSQKLVAAKTPKVAKRAVFFSGLLVYLIYAAGIIICYLLKLKGISTYSSDRVFPQAMTLFLSKGWLGLGYGVMFSVGATTLTSVWTGMVSLLPVIFGRKASHKPTLAIFICATSSLILAIYGINNLLEKIILANIPIVAMSFALLGGIYWKRASSMGVAISIFVGCVGGLLCYWYFGERLMYTWYWAVYIVPLIFLSGISVSIYFPIKKINYKLEKINC